MARGNFRPARLITRVHPGGRCNRRKGAARVPTPHLITSKKIHKQGKSHHFRTKDVFRMSTIPVMGRIGGDRNGGIAQLVEHELCKLGVTGSNPVASTSCDEARARRLLCKRGCQWFGNPVATARHALGRVAQLVRARP
jgi:hypothetical protein